MYKLIELALTLDILTPEQANKLLAIADFYKQIEDDLADCRFERDRLAKLAAEDIVEDSEILGLISEAIAATPMVG